eukprot:TRINITY_DN5006_c0_g1_i1.p1 TRINITY_DN5006_c0_g1~~TRINITY_DN5006_c0_g1_i1.p1  ORF type:complete len:365 (-),score=55.50 TRINITY_DN5006_c0_g1_i1:193-1287(-)
MQGFETPQQRDARQAAAVAKQVAEEFNPHQLQVGDHMSNVGTAERIYGGHMSDKPVQLSLVKVQRQRFEPGSMFPSYEEEVGVVHRVHPEDDTLTVQFPSDQHRLRVRSTDVQLVQFVDPTYPTVRLQRGQRLPNKDELDRREAANDIVRRQLGIPQGHMLPNQQDEALLEGERRDDDGKVVTDAGYWGIPVTTLDALKNRSIPPGQVGGAYGRHFYTSLYERYRAASIGSEGAYQSGQSASLPSVFGQPSGFGQQSGQSVSQSVFGQPNGFGQQSSQWPSQPSVFGQPNGFGQQSGQSPSQPSVFGQPNSFGQAGGSMSSGPMQPGGAPPGVDPNRIVDRVYIPLEGPEMRMNMRDGQWEPVR